MTDPRRDQTIRDFGEQWTRFPENQRYYASLDLLDDILAPLLGPADLRGARVADIGSGTGRIARLLLHAGAAHVVAVEPSAAFPVLQRVLQPWSDRSTLIHAGGEMALPFRDRDLVLCVGVLHHIPDPTPVVRTAFDALRPGGRFFAWLYGKEGNGPYLLLALPLRAVTRRLPHALLHAMTWPIEFLARPYIALCRRWPLPLHAYATEVLNRLAPPERRLVIYDQLNPAFAKYYTQREVVDLMRGGGFEDIKLHHRHGYSWSVLGTKAGNPAAGSTPAPEN